jgi:hypothetical protein
MSNSSTPKKMMANIAITPKAHDTLEQRVAAVIQAYDGQGNHRTGTEVDRVSAEWLANQVRQLGVEASRNLHSEPNLRIA